MKEFTLNSADKYKDGSPMMSDLPVQLVRLMKRIEFLEKKVNICQHNQEHVFARDVRILDGDIECLKYTLEDCDATLKVHGDTLEKHMNQINDLSKEYDMILEKHASRMNMIADYLDEHLDRICNLEHMYEQLISKLCAVEQHKGPNFCGNCTHVKSKDGVYTCKLLGGNIDPDDSSCSMFEPPF